MEETMKENDTETADNHLQTPAVRPPRKISKPKITLKMPPNSPQMNLPTFYQTPGGMMTIPLTPVTGLSPNYPIHFFQAYPNKAQEFMFKQFEGFKDFTMNTGKIGLNFGEKLAFWMYGRVRELSQNGFTHIFLFIIMCIYCGAGGLVFYYVEKKHQDDHIRSNKDTEDKLVSNITEVISNITKVSYNSTVKLQVENQIERLAIHFRNYYKLNDQRWELMNAVYFCGTVFTTIES